jgi:hypothetical protein
MEKFRIIFFQFVDQDLKFLTVILAIGGDQEQQDGIAFDMAKEPMAKTLAFRCTFYNAREVGDTK